MRSTTSGCIISETFFQRGSLSHHRRRVTVEFQDFTENSIDFECAWTKLLVLVLVLVGCIGNVLIEVPNTNDGVVEVDAIGDQF